MKDSTIKKLAPLLDFLRSFEVLEETPGHRFLLRGRDFVHFHDDPDGLWADAILSKGQIRMSVSSASEQGELMEKIAGKLESLQPQLRNVREVRRRRKGDER